MAPLYWFIVNPKSGSSVKTAAIRTLCQQLKQRGGEIRFDFTRSLAHAGEIAAEARDQDVAALLVCGGDGTVRTVAQGAAGGETPIMVIPTGTENLLASELGLDGTVDLALRTLDCGLVRNLDLGVANGRHFMAVLGVGFDAEVIRRINCFRSGHITHMDYLWPITRTYFEYQFPHLHAVADGRVICDEPGLLFVSNISRYAVGLRVAPQADFSNGMLDVTIYKCRKKRQLILHAGMTVAGLSHLHPKVVRTRCQSLEVSSPQLDTPVQIDGDPGPSLPLHIEVAPAAARVLAPPGPSDPRYRKPLPFFYLRRWLYR